MRKTLSSLVLSSLILATSVVLPARAEDPSNLPDTVEKRLQAFDPVAVAAARHYYTSPLLKASFTAMIPKIVAGLSAAVEHGNPGLDQASRAEASQAAQEAITGRLDLIIDMSMVAALEVLSKDELVAVDQFYSSPVGQSVMTKMPQVMNRLPAMMQVVMPLVIDDLRATMKAKGKDLKL
jgi:hypothetical protein